MKEAADDDEEEEAWIESPDGWGVPESVRHATANDDEEDEGLPQNGADLLFGGSDPREIFRYDRLAVVPARGGGGGPTIVLAGYKLDSNNTDQSTGVTLWPAASLLADYLVQYPELVREKRVLELGAGLGLSGLVAHHLGAATTVLTDGDKYVLAQLRSNMLQNTSSSSSGSSIECRTLLWGKKTTTTTTPPPSEDEKFDVLLGADVIYGWDSFEPLLDTVVAWMKKKKQQQHGTTTKEKEEEEQSSQFLLSWKTRYNGVPVDTVKSAARDRHLSWTEVSDGIYSLAFFGCECSL
jgi:16S rRNA G966 N2-methylase RsmD